MATRLTEFLAVLPALQHMARFNGANRDVVCRQRGIATGDLEAVVAREFGTWAGLDEESLEEIAGKLGVKLQPYQAPKPGALALAPVATPLAGPGRTKRVVKETAKETRVERRPSPEASEVASPWLVASAPKRAAAYLPIFMAIMHEGWAAVRPVLASRFGIQPAAFYACKAKYYGTGPLTVGKLASFTGWLQEQVGAGEGKSTATKTRSVEIPAAVSPAAGEKRGFVPCSPANTAAANAVLSSLADFEGWTELPDKEIAARSGPGGLLILNETLDRLLHARKAGSDTIDACRARVLVSPDKRQLAIAFGSTGMPTSNSQAAGLFIASPAWDRLVGETHKEWTVATLCSTGVVHLVLEVVEEGRAA